MLSVRVLQYKTYTLKYIFFSHFYLQASGQAVVTGVVPSPPPVLAFNFCFIAHRVQQSHCWSIFSSNDANSRSRAFRLSICAQEKVPTNL